MKNKEIEVLAKYLNGLISYPFQHKDKEYILSYIEQLENNRDKAIEYIENHTDKLKNIVIPKIDFNYKKLLDILKGDSDE